MKNKIVVCGAVAALGVGITGCGAGESNPTVTITETASPTKSSSPSESSPSSDKTLESTGEDSEETADDTATPPTDSPLEPGEETHGVSDEFSMGPLNVTVDEVIGGIPSLSDEFETITPQGQFVTVEITARNVGDGPAFVDLFIQIVDSDGRTYNDSEDASMLISLGDLQYEELNPGSETTGTVAFDIPTDVDPVEIQMSDENDWNSSVTSIDISEKEQI